MSQLHSFIALLNLNIRAGNLSFKCLRTKFIINLINVLIKHHYLVGYLTEKGSFYITVFFKLNFERSKPLMLSCKLISNLARPVYLKTTQSLHTNSSLWLLSTTRGILTSREALRLRIGGTLLCKIT